MIDGMIFTVENQDFSERIDKVISVYQNEWTRSFVQKILDNNGVTVNNIVVGKNHKVKNGDVICVKAVKNENISIEPEQIPLDIKYEDESLLVVNKPKGMVVHAGAGNFDGTLVNALLHHCGDCLSDINGEIRPGIVHRIDKQTSGLLIVAKDNSSHIKLAKQIKEHSFKRQYQAVVYGHLSEKIGTINAPIGRSRKNRLQMRVTNENSKNAVTHFEVVDEYNNFSHVKLTLETGRTHQIRVHMKHIGHPLAGDDVYGPRNVIKSLNGQCLHAGMIGFIHPKTGEYLEIESDLPDYFKKFLSQLNK